MDNQHQKIKGYRDLSQAEIDLMNRIKAHAEDTRHLLNEVQFHLNNQQDANPHEDENEPISTNPMRWLNIARTDLQTGFMAMVRSVAQPTTF